jgi:hypothetical protein
LSLRELRNALPGAARFTLLKLSNSLSTSSTKKAIGRYSVLNTPTKTQKHEQFHTSFIVTVGQFEKYIYNKISSYFRISYFISYENRMNKGTVPHHKTPESKL